MKKISLYKNKKGVASVIVLFATVTALFAVGISVDYYRISVDKQEISRSADIAALAIATHASLNEDICVISDANITHINDNIWEANRRNRNWEMSVISSVEQRENGIVRVVARSNLPLFYTAGLFGLGGYYVYEMTADAKCTVH